MRRIITTLTVLAGLSVAGISNAQESKPASPRTDRAQASRLDTVTEGANIRASKLIGMNIQNPTGEGLGAINDFVLDGNSGKVKYVAVTYGGFLGIGNKMFAVPFEAFKIKQNVNADMVLVLDVTQKQMEGAVGFDEAHWPDFADKKFQMELHKRYGVNPDRGVNVEVGRDGVKVDVNRDKN